MRYLSTILALCLSSLTFAQPCPQPASLETTDRIIFENGDVLTGQVLAISHDSVSFRHPVLGDSVVPWSAVAQVQSRNRIVAPSAEGESAGVTATFKTAIFTRSGDVVTFSFDAEQPRILSTSLTLKSLHCLETTITPLSSPTPAPAASGFIKRWFLAVNAPESMSYGTASQQTLGGSMTLELYEGTLNHTRLAATGTHNRSWQVGSSSVTTDTLDAFLQQGRSFGANRGGIYGKAETFLNTSLGVAREDSFGGGYYSPSMTTGPFQFKWLADLRYFRQRLYATDALNLIGSRVETNLIYRKADPKDKTKTKYSVFLDAWVNPMWNNESALRGFVTAIISFPLGRSVCLSFNPIEDDYLRNPPPGNRRNYATSYVTLAVQHGSDPNQRCY